MGPEITVLGVAVHGAGAHHGDVPGVLRENQSLVHRHRVALPSAINGGFPGENIIDLPGNHGVPASVGGAQQGRSLRQRQGDAAFQRQGAGEIGARREVEQAVFRQAVDGCLDGSGIVSGSVAKGTKVLHVHPGGDGFGGEFQLLLPLTGGDLQPVGRTGAQRKQGEHIGLPLKLLLPVQPHGILFRGIVGGVVFQLKASRNRADKQGFHIQSFLSLALARASARIRRTSCFMPTKSRSKPM